MLNVFIGTSHHLYWSTNANFEPNFRFAYLIRIFRTSQRGIPWFEQVGFWCFVCFVSTIIVVGFLSLKRYGSTWRFLFEACVATSVLLFLYIYIYIIVKILVKIPKYCWKISTSNLQIYENGYEIIYKFVGCNVPRNCNSNDSLL